MNSQRSSREPKRYFLSIYGEPGEAGPWGMRFDGHYLSLNWTAIAAQCRAQIANERQTLRFAYAVDTVRAGGGDKEMRLPVAGEPLYSRIQTADFLIEFDDTPKEANHIHIVIRSAATGYGRDTLREHYSAEHQASPAGPKVSKWI